MDAMKALTHAHFKQWMETYGRASAENDPLRSANLFAENARYYETPFADPQLESESHRDERESLLAFESTAAVYEVIVVD